MANRCGNNRNSDRLYILRLQKYCRWSLQPWNYKTLAPWKKNYDKSRQHTKKQSHYFANKYPSSQSYGFPIVTYGYESWTIKRASPKELMLLNCYGVGKDSWESLGLQRIQPVHLKWNQCWIFIGRTDAEPDTSLLQPPDAKYWLIENDPDTGKDWKREEKGTTDEMVEMVGWHSQLNGQEFE